MFGFGFVSNLVSQVRRMRVGLAVGLLALVTGTGGAQAACQTSLDFAGAAINATRTLDVSGCSFAIRWGLYTVNGSNGFDFPMTASQTGPVSAIVALPGGTLLRFTPGTQSTATATADGNSTAAEVFDSYTVTLLARGTGSPTATLYYASQAERANVKALNAGINPNDPLWTVDTAYPITVTLQTASAPEIAVAAPVFGAVADGGINGQGTLLGLRPVTVTYQVSNTGTAPLTLGTATVSATSNVSASATAPGVTTVAAGGTTSFSVTYTPTAAGAFSFDLSFTNNDSDENPFNFTVAGTALGPVLGLSTSVAETTQTVGRPFIISVTPSATVAPTSGQLTLSAAFPEFYGVSASGTGWSCSNSTPAFATTVTCTSTTSIPPGRSGNPVAFTVTSASAAAGYSQSFTLSGGGASANAVATSSPVTINVLPVTQLLVPSTVLTQGVEATSFTPVSVSGGGTSPFTWAVSPALPSGLTYDPANGAISGTPTAASDATNYVFTPTDARGAVPSAGSVATRTFSITVRPPAPVVTSISPPAMGRIAGGTTVQINGSNFAGATEVRFGTTAVTSGITVGPGGNRITVLSPPGPAEGKVRVSVVTPSGESADAAQDDFTYVNLPVISTSWSKDSIPADGTTQAVLSVTVSNPNANTTLSFPATAGKIPTGLKYVSAGITTTGGASIGAGGATVSTSGDFSFNIQSLPPGSTATLNLTVTSDTTGSYSFTTGPILSLAGTGSAATTPTPLVVTEVLPTITSLVTRAGPLAGGTTVVINGNWLLSATDVTFDGLPAQSFTKDSQTQITAVSPARATAGTVRVAVTNSAGSSPDTPADDFNYVAAPTLTAAFSPLSIPPNGSARTNLVVTLTNPNSVRLTGVAIANTTLPTGLTGATARSTCALARAALSSTAFGLGAASVPANDSCTVTYDLVSTTPGSYSIAVGQVSGDFGTVAGPTTAANLTVLQVPAVSAINPAFGPVAGGTPVTITGSNFTGATEVRFGAKAVFAAGLTVSGDGTQITLDSPPQSTDETVQVQVVTPGGLSKDAVNFTYAAPPETTAQWAVTSIPADDTATSSLNITVTNPNTGVALTGLNASGAIPTGLTVDALRVTYGPGTATGVNPTITGNSYSLDIGTLPAGGVVTLGIPVKSSTAGSYSVTTNATTSSVGNGLAATTASPLVVVARPFVTSVSPAQGPLAGGTTVTINGSNFSGATEVRFGGTAVPSTSFLSNNGAVIQVPAPSSGTAGTVRVSVVTAGGESADVAQDDFSYVEPPTTGADFSVVSIPGNGTSTADVVMTITNPNSVALSRVIVGAGTVPARLVGKNPVTTCSGATAILALDDYSVTGATVPANGSCKVSFQVTSTQAGSYSYTFGQLSGTFGTVAATRTSADLTVLAVPAITSISPTEGPLAGVPVTITGSGFAGATAVKFGGTTVTSDIRVNGTGTEITVPAPAGSAGVAQVSVVAPGGQSGSTPFTYVAAPTITSFTFGTTVPYNDGAAGSTAIDVVTGGAVTGAPTRYKLLNSTPGGGVVMMTGATGVVDYTPAVGFRGPFTFEINATNAGGTSSNATVTVNVGDPALVASVPVGTGTVGETYSQQVTISGGTGPYSAFSATGLPDGLTISSSGLISGTPTRAGTFASVVVTATDSSTGSGPFTGAAAAFGLTIGQATQTITFTSTAPTAAVAGGRTYALSATGGASGKPVTFYVDKISDNVCTVSGSVVSFVGMGICVVWASQEGDTTYSPAKDNAQKFEVGQGSQVITFTSSAPSAAAVGGATYTVEATGGASGNPVTLAIDAASSGVCAISGTASGSTVSFTGVGTCTIRASQAGNANFTDAAEQVQSFAVGQGSQAITFTSTAPSAAVVGGATYTVAATGGASGNPVSFAIDAASSRVCALSGSTVSFTGAGVCTIRASQAGNASYAAAPDAVQSFDVGHAAQVITFTSTAPSAAVVGGATYTVAATGGASGKPVTFYVDRISDNVCTVSGTVVSFVGVGTCIVWASQEGDPTYSPAKDQAQKFDVGQGSQAITFTSTAPSAAVVGGATYAVAATGGASGNPVSFAIDAASSGVCAISGTTVSFTGAGVCTIRASQAGNASYAAAPDAVQSFDVGLGTQTITFTSTAPSAAVVGGATYTVEATGGASGNPVSFAIDAASSGVCAISGTTVSFTGAGVCTIRASQAGNASYGAAADAVQSFDVGQAAQVITFTSTAPSAAVVGGASYTVAATGGASGNPVSFAIDAASSGVCALSGSTVSFTGAGVCTIRASQAGNASYAAAPDAVQSFDVGLGTQTITFTSTAPSAAVVGGATYTVAATGGASGNPVSFAIDAASSRVCALSGSTVSFTGAGVCTIRASQAGNASYAAAPDAVQSFDVGLGAQVITFTSTAPSAAVVGGATYTVAATGGASGKPVTFYVDRISDNVCTVSGTVVSFVGVGTCIVWASQEGDPTYSPAKDQAQKFEVGQGSQAITFTSTAPSAAVVGGATYTVAATGGASGNPVSFAIDAASSRVCALSGSTVSFTGAGECTIRASQAGNASYAAAPDAVQSFDVGLGTQVITFTSTAPSAAVVGGATYTVEATGGASGNPVSFTIDAASSGVCVLSGSTVSFTGAGVCTIRASQAGNASYAAAPDVVQSFDVGLGTQVITFPDPAQTEFSPGDTVQLTATATPSGLTVVFSSLTPDACTATADGLVRFVNSGACIVAADQPGDAIYRPAPQVTKTLNVTGVDPVAEADLIEKAQVARARALVLNQPDLIPLLDQSPEDSTALTVSTKGAEINLIRMGGPVWLRLSGSVSEQANGARDHYVQLSLGTHVSTGPQSILGLMATVDSIRLTDPTGQVDGRGWLIGPYFVTRLGTKDLAFELRALTGRTVDRVAQVGAPPSTVDGKRSLLMAKLSGSIKLDEHLTLSPSMSLAAVDQTSAAYLAFGGTPIPGVDTSYRQAVFGLNLQRESVNHYGPLTTKGGLGLFLSDTSGGGSGQGLSYSFGFAQKIGEGSSLEFDLSGQRDVRNDSDTVSMSVKFESRF